MKLQATCLNCQRRFLLSQLRPEPHGTTGRCPFCGTRFARHYVQILPELLDTAERASEEFVNALQQLRDMDPGFRVDIEAVLKHIREDMASAPTERSA